MSLIDAWGWDQLCPNDNKIEDTEFDGWISADVLPEEGKDVLVWFEYFRYGSYNRLYQTMGISFTYNGKWSDFVNGESGWHQLSIIAWQPLPKPPKKKKVKK